MTNIKPPQLEGPQLPAPLRRIQATVRRILSHPIPNDDGIAPEARSFAEILDDWKAGVMIVALVALALVVGWYSTLTPHKAVVDGHVASVVDDLRDLRLARARIPAVGDCVVRDAIKLRQGELNSPEWLKNARDCKLVADDITWAADATHYPEAFVGAFALVQSAGCHQEKVGDGGRPNQKGYGLMQIVHVESRHYAAAAKALQAAGLDTVVTPSMVRALYTKDTSEGRRANLVLGLMIREDLETRGQSPVAVEVRRRDTSTLAYLAGAGTINTAIGKGRANEKRGQPMSLCDFHGDLPRSMDDHARPFDVTARLFAGALLYDEVVLGHAHNLNNTGLDDIPGANPARDIPPFLGDEVATN